MTSQSPTLKANREYVAQTFSGYVMLLLLVVIVIVGLAAVAPAKPVGALIAVLCGVLFIFIAKGFYMLQPNQAAALTLFGSYKGTDRTAGLRWVWPWIGKTKVS